MGSFLKLAAMPYRAGVVAASLTATSMPVNADNASAAIEITNFLEISDGEQSAEADEGAVKKREETRENSRSF